MMVAGGVIPAGLAWSWLGWPGPGWAAWSWLAWSWLGWPGPGWAGLVLADCVTLAGPALAARPVLGARPVRVAAAEADGTVEHRGAGRDVDGGTEGTALAGFGGGCRERQELGRGLRAGLV
jgi:hypothetical protein